MAVRRQAYEWRNVMPVGQKVSLNNHPVLETESSPHYRFKCKHSD